jgi:thiamine pyrophosphate-dependent acetolactate synthase large subunit-like protein
LRECRECRAGGHSAKANVGIEYLDLGIDFPSLAKGYGVEGVRAATANDLKQVLAAALGSQAPTLIEVPTLAEGF